MPEVVGIYLTGEPIKGVGPQDVALAIIGEVFGNGFVDVYKRQVQQYRVASSVEQLSQAAVRQRLY